MTFELSIIVPVYNEEKRIHRLFEGMPDSSFLEVVFVCNGCTDNSDNVIRTHASAFRKTVFQFLGSGIGKGAAIQRGLGAARESSAVLGWTDADKNVEWGGLLELATAAHTRQVPVFGRRSAVDRSIIRKMISGPSNVLVRLLTHTTLPRDIGCPAKFFPRHCLPVLAEKGWAIDMEAALRTAHFQEIEVHAEDVPMSRFTATAALQNAFRVSCLLLKHWKTNQAPEAGHKTIRSPS